MDQPQLILQRVMLRNRRRKLPMRWNKPGYSGTETAQLAIAPAEPGGKFALLYLDANGKPLGTTVHERFDLAIGQAEWEFAVAPNEWELVKHPSAHTSLE